jgi:hypothetical protein
LCSPALLNQKRYIQFFPEPPAGGEGFGEKFSLKRPHTWAVLDYSPDPQVFGEQSFFFSPFFFTLKE